MAQEAATAEARRFGRTAGLLSIGVGASGLLTYVYFALASHQLDRTEYGEIVVLWSAVFITVSTIFRPIEQLLSRTIAERQAHAMPIASPLRVAGAIQLGLAGTFAAVALALKGPLENGLLSGDSTLYWIMVSGVLAYAASFYARGFLAGSRRFSLYATLLIAEAVSRVAFACAVAFGVASGQHVVAFGVVAAPCFSVLVVPLALVGGAGRRAPAVSDPPLPGSEPAVAVMRPGAPEPVFTLAYGGGFAAAVLLVMISEQTFMSGGPLLVRAALGAAEAGFIFNMLMVARAPLVLFQAIATSLLPHLTRLRSRGRTGAQAFSLSVRSTIGAIAVFAGLVTVVLAIGGPTLMQIAFGKKFEYDRAGLVIIAVGMGLYLSAATLNQAAFAQGQARRSAMRWVACAAGFLVWNLLPVLDEYRRVEIGFAVAAAALCGLLYLLYRRPLAHPGDIMEPGSPEELEARLAAADEAG